MTQPSHAYIAREPACRHATIAIVDDPEYAKQVASEIGKAVRMGMTIERVTVDRARKLLTVSLDFKHTKRGCQRRVK